MGLGQKLTKPSINVSEMNINLIAIYRGLLGTRLLSRSLYLNYLEYLWGLQYLTWRLVNIIKYLNPSFEVQQDQDKLVPCTATPLTDGKKTSSNSKNSCLFSFRLVVFTCYDYLTNPLNIKSCPAKKWWHHSPWEDHPRRVLRSYH